MHDFAAILALGRLQLQDFQQPLLRQGSSFDQPWPKDETHADYADGTGAPGQSYTAHLELALLNSRSLSWQRTTRDKLYNLISFVRKLKINVACISEMKKNVFSSSSLKSLCSYWQNQREYSWTQGVEWLSRIEVPLCKLEVNDRGKPRCASSPFSDGCGSDVRSGIGERVVTHLSGKIVEIPIHTGPYTSMTANEATPRSQIMW